VAVPSYTLISAQINQINATKSARRKANIDARRSDAGRPCPQQEQRQLAEQLGWASLMALALEL
jgi:hypothetical protein